MHSNSDLLKVSLIMFYLNMVVFFPFLCTLTLDTFMTLRGTWGYYLNHELPLRPFKFKGLGGWPIRF